MAITSKEGDVFARVLHRKTKFVKFYRPFVIFCKFGNINKVFNYFRCDKDIIKAQWSSCGFWKAITDVSYRYGGPISNKDR